MKCVRCGSEDRIKNGVLQGVQRYKCKSCGYNYTVAFRRGTRPADQKRMALLMYLDRSDFERSQHQCLALGQKFCRTNRRYPQ